MFIHILMTYILPDLLFGIFVFTFTYFTFDFWQTKINNLRGKFRKTPIETKEVSIIEKETAIIHYGDDAYCLLEKLTEFEIEGNIIKRKVKVHMWLAKCENVTNADKQVASGIENFVWCPRYTAAAIFKSRHAVLSFLNIYKLDLKNLYIRPLAKSSY
jgi:hypothetical protein